MEAGPIKAIDKGSVHRICSGQVVLTLATAVKELVENSIDAGASIVDIKLKEYGSDMIEVSDNGSGVEEKNFEGLTLKHHTSKIEDFSDLVNVETFGFRGEALSSLCALSNLCIVTRHKSVEVGTKLEYDHNGRISSKTSVARQVGTTVTLQNLFHTLPVRHREFQRNLKKEFVKMVHVLNAYCLVNTGVRITCTNQTGKGNKSSVVSSKGNPTMKENISNIFGPKQVQSLLEFKQTKPTEEVSTEYGIKMSGVESDLYKIEGYISKCEHGQGRSSADRQFYFINKRPCDHSKISKLVNEVYHQYNRHQYPFVALSISMGKESVDVNVTPDKRQIFIENEKLLLAVIKTSLIEMFEPTSSVYNVNCFTPISKAITGSPIKSRSSLENHTEAQHDLETPKSKGTSSFSNLKRSFSSSFSNEDSQTSSPVIEQRSKQRKLDNFIVTSSLPSTSKEKFSPDVIVVEEENIVQNVSIKFETPESIQVSPCKLETDPEIVANERREIAFTDSESSISTSQETDSQSSSVIVISSSSEASSHNIDHSDKQKIEEKHIVNIEDIPSDVDFRAGKDLCIKDTTSCVLENMCNDSTSDGQTELKEKLSSKVLSHDLNVKKPHEFKEAHSYNDNKKIMLERQEEVLYDKADETDGHEDEDRGTILRQNSPSVTLYPESKDLQITCLDEKGDGSKKEKKVAFSLTSIKEKARKRNQKFEIGESFCRTFRAKISPTDNKSAEEELQKEIKKDMFSQMDILGQFNLGFIIAKLKSDLFIVDQHATDEKYNFEMLQRHTVIQSQKLIHPQNLELTSSNEIILMENIEVFRKNGFDFIIDEQADPTQRVKLISTPVSKNWSFGKEDVEELIFMLTDSTGVMCRPSRVRQMFASRACRKSIMIGTALSKAEMKKLVVHMGEIEQPWNCPHGRPTMRHLINLNMVPR